jgi:uncharacterized protein YkwD
MKFNIPRIVLIVSIVVGMLSCSDDETVQPEDIQTELLQAINILRTTGCTCGNDTMPPVNPVTWNDTLEHTAQDHAIDMYTYNYLNHLSRDGTPPIIRTQQAGYSGIYVGENIARGYFTVADVMKGWEESESHCKNMMDTTYTEIGASKIADYWVLDLGRPK